MPPASELTASGLTASGLTASGLTASSRLSRSSGEPPHQSRQVAQVADRDNSEASNRRDLRLRTENDVEGDLAGVLAEQRLDAAEVCRGHGRTGDDHDNAGSRQAAGAFPGEMTHGLEHATDRFDPA